MIHTRRFPMKNIIIWGSRIAGMGALWSTLVFFTYRFTEFEFMRIPFLPIATIGTAVAFYVGFKNNSAYERFWEGRKIWGGIINASRTWGNAVMSYVLPGDSSDFAVEVRKRLMYRHMAWINALRLQLRKTSRFHHKPARMTKIRLQKHATHMRNDWDAELKHFLSPEEFEEVSQRANSATHLIRTQGDELQVLVKEEKLSIFHQIDLMRYLEEFYALQGKCERIKNTPFPRQYAEFSRLFTRVFTFLVPFGLLDVFAKHVHHATITVSSITPVIPMILSSALISWVFSTMEGIGDSSEDPFERSMNDVPMNALCRTIEIDLREMLGETELPEKEKPIDNILY
ncbi:MAG: bestrophin family ion channel [Spirochaetota bacterium]